MIHDLMPGPMGCVLPDMEANIGVVRTLETHGHGIAQAPWGGHIGAPMKGVDAIGYNGACRCSSRALNIPQRGLMFRRRTNRTESENFIGIVFMDVVHGA